MAFNVNDYVKDTSKSALAKISDNIVSSSTAGLSAGVSSVANSISQTLLGVGASLAVTTALTTLKTDSTASGADSTYFALAGQNVDRTAGVSLSSLRRSTDDINTILTAVNPETKIATNKTKDAYTISAII